MILLLSIPSITIETFSKVGDSPQHLDEFRCCLYRYVVSAT